MRDPSSRLIRHLPAAGIFAFLAVALTWPLVLRFRTAYPSFELWFGGDPNMYVWLIDWAAKALTGVLPVPAGQMLFFPTGIETFGGYDGPLMLAAALPVRLISGNPILAYNAFILAALWSGATAAYALAYRETKVRWQAMIAGIAFGFSPYALVRAGQHPNLLMLAVLPLLALAMFRFAERPDIRRGAALGGAVLLTALSSWYYLIGSGIFLAIAFLVERRAFMHRRSVTIAAVALLAVAASVPALPMLMNSSGSGSADASFVAPLGMQPLNLILPHPATNALGALTGDAYAAFPRLMPGNPNYLESTSYLGILLLLAVLTLSVPAIRERAPHARLWAWTFGVFMVLALGTELRIGGFEIPMPFALLHRVFPFSLVRAPNRLFVFALLAATMLALPAISAAAARMRSRRGSAALVGGIVALLLIERVMLPFPLFTPQPSAFHRTLAASPETSAVADLPIVDPGISLYNVLQITHGRPIVDGEYFYPAYNDETFAFIRETPLLSAMVCDVSPPSPPTDAERADSFRRLAEAGVGHVAVHNLIMRNVPLCGDTLGYARAFFDGIEPEFADGAITVYRVPPAEGGAAPAPGVQ